MPVITKPEDQQRPLSNVSPDDADTNNIASTPPESSHPPTGPPASIRSILSRMKYRMLRLRNHELLALGYVEPYSLGHVLNNIPGLIYDVDPSEISYLASLPGARHLVRMFWVLSVARWDLERLNHMEIEFFQLDLVQDRPMFKRLLEAGFDDLETVLLCIYSYRDVLLRTYVDKVDDRFVPTRDRFVSKNTTEDYWDGLGREEYFRRSEFLAFFHFNDTNVPPLFVCLFVFQ